MSFSVKDALVARDIHPSAEHLEKLEAKWKEIQGLKKNLDVVTLDDADIAVRNIPGGDHVE
ncbi:hypothetical protein [Corynebacterium maris]|uniref:hypothetical protein n=1 Tax=Corynebacterium maris TaxID=575200 RepID=UPI0005A2968E|nr:hypothetical protein [Corynebacterium maris]